MDSAELDRKIDAHIDQENVAIESILRKSSDPTLVILRIHLLIEGMLERIIRCRTVFPDDLLEKGNLTFYQKLLLVESFGDIKREYIIATRSLNKIRNKLAHEDNDQIGLRTIEQIGQSLGEKYRTLKQKHGADHSVFLIVILLTIHNAYIKALFRLEVLKQSPKKVGAAK